MLHMSLRALHGIVTNNKNVKTILTVRKVSMAMYTEIRNENIQKYNMRGNAPYTNPIRVIEHSFYNKISKRY